jgi:hypothetical protein
MMFAESAQALRLLKDDRVPAQVIVDATRTDDAKPFGGIRCPLCAWRPLPSSVWTCSCSGTPEPFFKSCGTVWNTFSTGGRCPGCSHQWQWTSCLRCSQWSLHEDWYEQRDEGL